MEMLRTTEKGIAWLFHSTVEQSVAYHHALMWDWMPQELKGKDLRTRTTYVSYKAKVGFSEAGFVLPNLARCTMKTYEMDRDKAVEGGKPDYVFCDELVPCDWVETLEYRTAERGGRLVVGFTPVHGYSETVGMFLDDAEVTRWCSGYLLPKDGGPADAAAQMGISEPELKAYGEWLDDSMRGSGPRRRCVPEDSYQESGDRSQESGVRSQESGGRKFERVPRVARCGKAERGVLFVHSTDNPFGNPLAVWRRCEGMSAEKVKERFYGWATRQYGCLFGKFSRKVHVIPHEKVPKDGTMYCVIDPAGNRNWFAVWVLARPDGWYVVQEFPDQVTDVPGVGVMGPWAEPDGKLRDGRRGDGQVSLGWSLLRYKQHFAEIEGWRDATADNGLRTTDNGPEHWREENGSRMAVFERMMDSRFGGAVQQGVQGTTTLIEECCRIGLTVVPATVDVAADGRHAVSEGYQFITNALDWDEGRPMDATNRPKLWVSERCKNVIYAIETHTGVDGQRGATKDVIDVLRMGFLKGMPYIAPGWRLKCAGGGHY
jgi:phage terminase large subunit-like protein